jgi:hypothetical protein
VIHRLQTHLHLHYCYMGYPRLIISSDPGARASTAYNYSFV